MYIIPPRLLRTISRLKTNSSELSDKTNSVVFILKDDGKETSSYRVTFGERHVAFLSTKGNVFVYGDNEFGQLGLGPDVSQVNNLTRVENIYVKIVKIVCERYSVSALTESGHLIRWGRY